MSVTHLTHSKSFHLGLDDWAALHGIDPSTGLILSAALLSNIAGPRISLNGEPGLLGSLPPSLAIAEADPGVRSALASLVSVVRSFENGLVNQSREFQERELVEVMYGAMEEGSDKARQLFEEMHRNVAMLTPEGLLGADVSTDGKIGRFEALVRPRFLVEGALPADLKALAVRQHDGKGVLAGALEVLPADPSKRRARLEALTRILAGEEAEIPKHLNRSLITHQQVSLRGVLMFSASDFRQLLEEREFLPRLVPLVVSNCPASHPVCHDAGRGFVQKVKRALWQLLAQRRYGCGSAWSFSSEEGLALFLNQQLDFRRELAGHPGSMHLQQVLHVPAMAAWALMQLSGGRLPDEQVIEQAFKASREVLGQAHRLYLEHDRLEAAKLMVKDAKAIVCKLAGKGPMNRQQLMRSFHRQKYALHEPAITALINLGIVARDGEMLMVVSPGELPDLKPAHFIQHSAIP